MATIRFDLKQFDLRPVLRIRLLDGITPVNLTTASEVRLLLKNRATGLKVNAVMTKLNQADAATVGFVEYTWLPGDTNTLGTFQGEIQVLWAGGQPQTFPAKGYFTIAINRDLNLGPVTV